MSKSNKAALLIVLFPVCLVLSSACNNEERSKRNVSPAGNETRRPDPRPPDSFFTAALDGDSAVIKKFLSEGVAVNAFDSDARTALMYAAYNGQTAIIKMLLAGGASVDMRDFNGRTALMLAASGSFPEAVRLLLDNHADPNLYDKEEHYTALMYAAAEGQLENVKILLKYNADPTLKDADGDLAVTFAGNNKHNEVVDYMISKTNQK